MKYFYAVMLILCSISSVLQVTHPSPWLGALGWAIVALTYVQDIVDD